MNKKIFGYEGHVKTYIGGNIKETLLIYHGKENGRYIFTHNLIGKFSNDIIFRTVYQPKKVYHSSKGDYVNIGGYRQYFKDLVYDYEYIEKVFEGK